MAYIFKKVTTRWLYQGERVTAAKAKRLIKQGKSVEKVQEQSASGTSGFDSPTAK